MLQHVHLKKRNTLWIFSKRIYIYFSSPFISKFSKFLCGLIRYKGNFYSSWHGRFYRMEMLWGIPTKWIPWIFDTQYWTWLHGTINTKSAFIQWFWSLWKWWSISLLHVLAVFTVIKMELVIFLVFNSSCSNSLFSRLQIY